MIIRHAHNSETSLQTAVRQKTSRESKLSRHNQSLGKVAVCVSAALCVDPHCTHTHTHTHWTKAMVNNNSAHHSRSPQRQVVVRVGQSTH